MERYRKQREHEAHQQKIKIEKAIEVQRAHEVEIRSWAQRLPAEQLRFEYEKRERKIVKLERELKEFENWANKPGNNWDDDYAPAKQGRRELYNHLSRLREEKEIIEQVLDERWR